MAEKQNLFPRHLVKEIQVRGSTAQLSSAPLVTPARLPAPPPCPPSPVPTEGDPVLCPPENTPANQSTKGGEEGLTRKDGGGVSGCTPYKPQTNQPLSPAIHPSHRRSQCPSREEDHQGREGGGRDDPFPNPAFVFVSAACCLLACLPRRPTHPLSVSSHLTSSKPHSHHTIGPHSSADTSHSHEGSDNNGITRLGKSCGM